MEVFVMADSKLVNYLGKLFNTAAYQREVKKAEGIRKEMERQERRSKQFNAPKIELPTESVVKVKLVTMIPFPSNETCKCYGRKVILVDGNITRCTECSSEEDSKILGLREKLIEESQLVYTTPQSLSRNMNTEEIMYVDHFPADEIMISDAKMLFSAKGYKVLFAEMGRSEGEYKRVVVIRGI
jgi:hypothetical protein